MLTMMVDNIEEAELCKIAEKFVQEIDHSQVDHDFDSLSARMFVFFSSIDGR